MFNCSNYTCEKELLFDLSGQVIYYALPAPAKPGHIIG